MEIDTNSAFIIGVGIAVAGGLIALAIYLSRRVDSTGYSLSPVMPAGQLSPVVTNAESWEWTDYKGQARKITVHREVKA